MTVNPSVRFLAPSYCPPWYLPNGHWQTIAPTLIRKVRDFTYRRQQLPTPDGDLLQIDVLTANSPRLAIISHGLEGDSNRPYVRGMTRAFHREGYDVLAWNFRSCGGVLNRSLRFYHSGATDDLHHLLTQWPGIEKYASVVLIGFSLGGNLTLKYVGEDSSLLPANVRAAITFSVPLDLQRCAQQITQPSNRIYHRRFLKQLKQKVIRKHPLFPDELSIQTLNSVRTLIDFDDYFTAPLHGFCDAADYYQQCSSRQFLRNIRIPTLIVNAQNDPFLAPECYNVDDQLTNQFVTFLTPEQGGHCGFWPKGHRRGENYWSEQVAIAFARTYLP